MGAVLATYGVLSHRAAAALWRLLPSDYLEVISETNRRRTLIHVHRSVLASDEVTTESGIPVTGVSRTLLDLASVVRTRRAERALHQADVYGLTDRLSLPDLFARHPNHAGTRVLALILEAGVSMTRSSLEERFLDEFVPRARLPRPEVNAWLPAGGQWFECDVVWRRERVIVELNGRAYHRTAAAFEHDRARDRRLSAAGGRVIRVTWRQVHDEPDALAADLWAVLGGER